MATNFPTSLDSLTNPTATSTLASPSHSAQHADANDAIEALEAKVGVNNSAVTTSLDYRVRNPELVGGAARPLLTGGAYIDGTNGLVLSSLTGNFASTPDSAALSITGDIDIKVKFTGGGWAAPTQTQTLVNKYSVSGQKSYRLNILNPGLISLGALTDGTNGVSQNSTSATSAWNNGGTKWARATLDVDDGAGNHVYKFYTSDDGTTWTQLGSTVTTAGTTSIFDGTSPVLFGDGLGITSGVTSGTIHRVIIQDAFDTADNTTNVVFDADFSAEAADTLAFTEDSTNAATVSVTTTRYTVGYPTTEFESVTAITFGANADVYMPFQVDRAVEVDMFLSEVTTAAASSATVYYGIYPADDNYQPNGNVLATGSTVIGTSTGVFYTQITPVTLPPGKYLCLMNTSVGATFRGYVTGKGQIVHTLGSNGFVNLMTKSRTAATFPTTTTEFTSRFTTTTGIRYATLLRWKAV